MVTVHEIQNPIGIDAAISILQKSLKKKLGWDNVEIYGRVHKIRDGKSIIPQAYVGNGEYKKDVLTSELNKNKVFFVPTGTTKTLPGGQMETTVKTVFIVDLSVIFPEVTHRADQEAIHHVNEIIGGVGLFKNIVEIQTDVKDVLKEFDWKVGEILDIHPRKIFSINSKVKYFINNC